METSDLGLRLAALTARIVETWVRRVRDAIPGTRGLDHGQLVDNLPTYLDALVAALGRPGTRGASEDDLDELSRVHGLQRSTLVGSSVRHMLLEYRLLREVVFELLEEKAPLSRAERNWLLGAIEQAMASASAEFVAAEHVQTRRELEESEARFRQIANALPLIVWTATGDFYVDWYNDWWFKYLGLPRGTRWDDPATQPMHPEDVERTRAALREAVATGSDFLMEQRFRRGSDGQYRWHLVRGVPIRDATGKLVKWIGANADIHDQKTVTARLEEERELRERFVATLTHDLRSPLTAARANAQMLARRGGDPDLLHKLSARIVENLDRADHMIRDLLDANRIRAGEPVPLELTDCDLTGLVRDAVDELSLVHGERFVVEGPEGLEGQWSCEALRRIVENLCNNAVKYGATDHPVTVRIARWGEDEVSLSVHNWGSPISPEDQKLLFQQYRRLDSAKARAHRGWGLGLTLVEGLARAHGGSVRVESAPATGTTFSVVLPRHPAALPLADAEAPPAP